MQYPLAGHDKRGGAQADLVVLGNQPDTGESLFHDAHQASIDFGFVQKKLEKSCTHSK